MESFRNLIKGWLGKVLLVLFLTPFALVGIEGYFSGGQKADVAKTVNGHDISKQDLDNQTKSLKQQYLQYANGDQSLLNTPFIENEAMDGLIKRTLLASQAGELNLTLSDEQIMQMLEQVPDFQQGGKFSNVLFNQYLKQIGKTRTAWIDETRQSFTAQILSASIAANALVNRVDLQQMINLQGEKRNLLLSSIPLDSYKNGIRVSDQELKDYYAKHQNKFKQPASVDVDYIVVSPSMLSDTQATVTEDELAQAYSQYVEQRKKEFQHEVKHILIGLDGRDDAAAKKRADEVYAKIKAGQSFASAAAEFSDDTDSKSKGGLLSNYVAGAFGEGFDAAVSQASATVSAPVKTQYGYHLIESKAISEPIPSFEQQKPILAAELQKIKSMNAFTDQVNRLNELVIDNDSLEVVTHDVKSAKVESAKGIGLSNKHPVLSAPNVKVKLFNADVESGDRNASTNIQLDNGDMVWLKVRDYHAAGVQSFETVKAKLTQQLIEKKAYEAAKTKLAPALAQFKSLPGAEARSKSGLNFEHEREFTRSQGLKREIERAAFSLPAPKAGQWSVTTAALPNELVVIALTQVTMPKKDEFPAEQLQQLSQLYQGQRGVQLLNDYTEYLKSNAKIK